MKFKSKVGVQVALLVAAAAASLAQCRRSARRRSPFRVSG